MEKPFLVALTGAGISAESGLQTFRDSDGLWEGYNIEDVATPRAWKKDPAMVLDFYNQRRKGVAAAQPNEAHYLLARLEERFEVQIITQNIDDLHERAGSTRVLHLHGEIFRMRSDRQPHVDALSQPVREDMEPGARAPDGGLWRPHIVWFEEAVPAISLAVPWMAQADVFILVGTSLVVYPAAGLVDYVRPETPKYVVDKRIPPVSQYRNVIPVQKPATEGMQEVWNLLQR